MNSPTVAWLKSAAREASYRLSRLLPEANDGLRADAVVWVLGREFAAPADSVAEAAVARCVRACIWFTYRQGFAPIPGTIFTSDAGWGCMMRSGQMIVAAAMVRLQLARRATAVHVRSVDGAADPPQLQESGLTEAEEEAIVRVFADSVDAPFSLPCITAEGAAQGTSAGSWMGPAAIAQVMARLAVRANSPDLLRISVAMDGTLYQDEVRSCILLRVNPG